MPALALVDALKDFGARPPRLEAINTSARQRLEPAQPDPAPPKPDIKAIVAAEVARAETALTERLRREHEAAMATAIEAERNAHLAEMEAVTWRLGAEAGAAIATGLGRIEAEIEESVTASVARTIAGLLSAEVERRSLDALARAVREAIGDREAVRIRVRGPQSVMESLRQALGPHADGIDFEEAPGLDISVAIDGSLFETRLSEWSSAISEVLA